MKAILMALLMVVSFSILGCGEEKKPEAKKPGEGIKKVVTTPPAKAVDNVKNVKKLLDD